MRALPVCGELGRRLARQPQTQPSSPKLRRAASKLHCLFTGWKLDPAAPLPVQSKQMR